MGLRATIIMLLATLATASTPATAQISQCPNADSCHGGGKMAMSPDGAVIAATVLGQSARQFVLIDVATQRATIIEAPENHRTIGDLAWSADGDELTFLTAEGSVYGGDARHVWRLRRGDTAPTIDLIAEIPCVRRPVLSADGATLTTYEGIPLNGDTCNVISAAYAVFERPLTGAAPTRRTAGQTRFPGELFFDHNGALYITQYEPVFAQTLIGERLYWTEHDSAGHNAYRWAQETRTGPAFRLAPGETLPAWPTAVLTSGPARGSSPVRAHNDGRLIVFGQTTPASPLDWYDENGRARAPTRAIEYAYFALAADGSAEPLDAPGLPEDAGRTGGADISADARIVAEIVSPNIPQGTRPGGEAWDFRNELRLHENGQRTLTVPIATLLENAPTITPPADEPAMMPAVSAPHLPQ